MPACSDSVLRSSSKGQGLAAAIDVTEVLNPCVDMIEDLLARLLFCDARAAFGQHFRHSIAFEAKRRVRSKPRCRAGAGKCWSRESWRVRATRRALRASFAGSILKRMLVVVAAMALENIALKGA